MINRTKIIVLGFFAAAWLSLLLILAVAPSIYDGALKVGPGDHRAVEVVFLVALTAFLVLLSLGTVQGWRWMFWLILIAFFAGIVRVPAAVLQLAGILPPGGPAWYEVFQGAIGLVQFGIGLVMVAGYRKAGTWGDI